MKLAWFRFYGPLNDFLPSARRGVSFLHAFDGRVSLKDLIEALGVPHTEIDLLLANDRPVDFSSIVENGDRIAVFPRFEQIDIAPITRVRPAPPREIRFVLDAHLGRLAAYLRLAGFDTLYQNDYRDEELAAISSREERILLTRDLAALKRSVVAHGYYVRATNPRRQLVEVLQRFGPPPDAPFERCLRCNTRLEPVSKTEVVDRLPPRTREHYHEFHRCPGCERLYWKGSHWTRLEQFLDRALVEAGRPTDR